MPLPESSFFLFGARGTGKTTFLEEHLRPALLIELLSQENYLNYATDPALLRRELLALPDRSWVWIDEIQRLPPLLNEVHWAIEKKKLKFALSGSSARKLRRAGVNLLAGRALSRTFFPFLPSELGRDFKLEEALIWGTLPLVMSSPHRKETLKAYVHSYLREEVQADALFKDLPSFARFLKVAALLHGKELSLSAVARDVGVKRPTVENYFSILEDTLLATLLRPLDASVRVKERTHPKFYWFDAGIVHALREDWGALHPADRGHFFEGLVLMVLRACQSYIGAFDEIHYWASADVEVDFVIKKDGEYFAIEAKSSERHRPGELGGLRAIADLPRLRKRIVVHPDIKTQKTEDGILVLGFAEFCRRLESGQLWSRN